MSQSKLKLRGGGFKYTTIAKGYSDKYVQWQCSCGQWHTGSPIKESDWPGVSAKHTPQVVIEKWMPIGSKVVIPGRNWGTSTIFTVVGYDLTNWDVFLQRTKELDGDGGRRCNMSSCVPVLRVSEGDVVLAELVADMHKDAGARSLRISSGKDG